MKIYDCPKEVPPPVVDYSNYDSKKVAAEEAQHVKDLEAHLRSIGYAGANTGRIARFHVGDGKALYMMAEGSKSFLVHLPYGDAYHYRDIEFLPKKEVLARMESDERVAKMFAEA